MLTTPIESRMFRPLLIAALIAASSVAVAETWIGVTPTGGVCVADAQAARPPTVQVHDYDSRGVDLVVGVWGVELGWGTVAGRTFVRVGCPESLLGGEVGGPALPVVRRLFCTPPGTQVAIEVQAGPCTLVDLAALGYGEPVWPMQPPLDMDVDAGGTSATGDSGLTPALFPLSLLRTTLQVDEQAYTRDALQPEELATIRPAGMFAGLQLHLLEVRPLAYNPATGMLAVWPRIEVGLRFEGDVVWESPRRIVESLRGVLLNPPAGDGPRDGRAGNYLIVTAQDFVGSAPLLQFTAAKEAQGFTVMTQPVAPSEHRIDIKAQITDLWGTPDEPDYIVVVGDALEGGGYAGTYSVPIWMGTGTKNAYSDTTYACMDGTGDWFPDIPIGRIPVRTVSELQDVIDKILYVEAGVYTDPSHTTRAAMAAHPSESAEADALQDYTIDTFLTPRGIESTKLYASQGADTQDVADAVNAGTFLVTYFGHAGGFKSWAAPYFANSDVEVLSNADAYPFVVAFSCSVAGFQWIEADRSPGHLERWLTVPLKGASACYGITRTMDPYTWQTWRDMYRFLFQSIYIDDVRAVGPASLATNAYFLGHYGAVAVTHDYVEQFIILGDPSMELPLPPPENYLIVTAETYNGSAPLNQFIAAKQAQGYNVLTYVAMSGTSNSTIKSYIESLWPTADAPNYVLLVGDTNGSSATSTTVPHFTGGASKHCPTDLPYGCMDAGDDWWPEIPVGRFSVTSVSMLQDVVDKSLFVEAGNFSDPDYVKRGAFLANPSTQGMAEPTHDWVIDNYFTPNDYTGIKLYSAQGAGTSDVRNAVNNGCLWVGYYGHSSSTGWWDPSFDQPDVQGLSNAGLYGVAWSFSCNVGNYSLGECFGETWHREADKGAAAVIFPSAYIYWGSVEAWEPSTVLEKSFFRAFFEDDIWEVGPAWQAGLYHFLDDYTGSEDYKRNFFELYNIMGDPALHLPRPDGFTLSPVPTSYDLCAPPATQAVYTIEVGQLGTFNEAVTLSVTGEPLGATVDFDVNSQSPPFTSVLTLGNLDNVSPAHYNIAINGTSASKQRSVAVELNIAGAVPDTPTLVSPANGADDAGLMPELTWQSATGAIEYELEVATNPSFSNIVYQVTVTGTSHGLESPLAQQTLHYWHVRASNACGDGDYSPPFSFTTVNVLMPTSYDLLNGETGSYTYFDDNYNGQGDNSQPLAPLTGGLGDLTDGVIATGHWNQMNLPYIGWSSIEPTITFHFAESVLVTEITLHVDDSGGGGGVVPPSDVVLHMGDTTLEFEVTDPPGSEPFAFTVDGLTLTGTTLEVTLEDDNFSTSRYMMLSEVEFNGGPNTGACCVGAKCTVMTEEDCALASGEYQGNGTDCDPNPCVEYDPACLIISEVVQGTESGDCPRWIEITNTGKADFAFIEGGIIVQTGDSSDVDVDVDLSGYTIAGGQSFVVNSNFNNECTGAFDAIYPVSPDFYTNVPFGYGNERFLLTDTADGSHIIDIYGEFGVDGSGQPWEFTDGYSYREPEVSVGFGADFVAAEWYFGGVGSLAGGNPTQLLLDYTSPTVHVYNEPCSGPLLGDLNCDGVVDFGDINAFVLRLSDPDGYRSQYPTCPVSNGDINEDGVVDFGDINPFVMLLSG